MPAPIPSVEHPTPLFDGKVAREFFRLLEVDPSAVHYRGIHWDKTLMPKSARGVHVPPSTQPQQQRLEDLQQRGFRLYWLPNGGPTDEHVSHCRFLFIEWDDGTFDQQLQRLTDLGLPEPTAMLHSGGKSLHCYWRLEQPIPAADWRGLIERLIHFCKSDPSCKNPSRLMRLPGSTYIRKEDGSHGPQASLNPKGGASYPVALFDANLPPLPAPEEAPSLPLPATPPAASVAPAAAGQTRTASDPRSFQELERLVAAYPEIRKDNDQYHEAVQFIFGLCMAAEEAGHTRAEAVAMASRYHPGAADTFQDALNAKIQKSQGGSFIKMCNAKGVDTRRQDIQRRQEPPSGWDDPPASVADAGPGADAWMAPAQGQADIPPQTFSQLADLILQAIRDKDIDLEMKSRAELKTRFRVSDDQIQTELFKRHSIGKVQSVRQSCESVDLARIQTLSYAMDGWIPRGDVALTYGAYGTGKTTLILAKGYAYAKGENILDRDTPCEPGKVLFIATDSGLGPLKKSMEDLGIDPETDPLFRPGPQRRIWVWGHAPEQGHLAWECTIHGIIRLETFIRENRITYVAIDSAKSVSSTAGWSYTANEPVKALLKYLREVIAQPTGCCIEFLSHDGTAAGSHSGAKAWAEDPSMVVALQRAIGEDGSPAGVTARFRKDRAATVEPNRSLTFHLADGALVLSPEAEVVGSCEEALVRILWEARQRGLEVLSTGHLIQEAFQRFQRSRKTVENTLGSKATSATFPRPGMRIVKRRKGYYGLAPAELQRREAAIAAVDGGSSSPLIGVSIERGVLMPDPLPQQPSGHPPTVPPGGLSGGGGSQGSNPPVTPRGVASGSDQTAVTDSDLPTTPPMGHGPHTREAASNPPIWGSRLLELHRAHPHEAPFTLALRLQTDHGFQVTGQQVQACLDRPEHSTSTDLTS